MKRQYTVSSIDVSAQTFPSRAVTIFIIAIVITGVIASIIGLLSIQDAAQIKQLIEDDGPVQLLGQNCIALAFIIALTFAVVDPQRRKSFLMLSYILLFYTLREADYHYKVSEYAKATQIKRFYLHGQIPLSTKLLMAAIVILLLVVLYRYVRQEKDTFIAALRQLLPWSMTTAVWAVVLGASQIIDQVPLFHSAQGQVFEEVLESSAEVLALTAVILFLVQVYRPAKPSDHHARL